MRRDKTNGMIGIPSLPEVMGQCASDKCVGFQRVIDSVAGYFGRYGCPADHDGVLVALSGGPDSVALLSVMLHGARAKGWTLAAGHVNYRLRGTESDDDEKFCRALCRTWEVPIHVHRVPLSSVPVANRQHWARTVRYDFFKQVADDLAGHWIATGHHLNDRAESFAAAVLDAGGTFALAGIPPVRGRIIRPLFDCHRGDILAMLDSLCIPYRTDRSNDDVRYHRNVIRHEILPQWERRNPSIAEGLARTASQLWEQRRFLEKCAARLIDDSVRGTHLGRITLAAEVLSSADDALDPYILRLLAGRIGIDWLPTTATVERFRLLRHDPDGPAKTVEQGRLRVLRSMRMLACEDRSRVQEIESEAAALVQQGSTLNLNRTYLRLRVQQVQPAAFDDRQMAYIDLDSLQGRVALRRPQNGDRYRPIGLRGTKKLSDIFAERRIPAFQRADVPVLADNAGILWPVGCPVAERGRITPSTRAMLVAEVFDAERSGVR